MGYTHGTKWSDDLIAFGIYEVMKKADITVMPSKSIIEKINGDSRLSNAISKHGGFLVWAKRLGLEISDSETKIGKIYEEFCANYITNVLKKQCEMTSTKHPYDILVCENVKIDVKVGHLYNGTNGNFYTFNLEKKQPTCDIFVCYCVDDMEIEKTYVIPSCFLSGKSQLSVGASESSYDCFRDKWEYIKKYELFYNEIKAGA